MPKLSVTEKVLRVGGGRFVLSVGVVGGLLTTGYMALGLEPEMTGRFSPYQAAPTNP